MLTTMTHVTLQDGKEPEWDQAMGERLEAARARRGWVQGQVLIQFDRPNQRVILGEVEHELVEPVRAPARLVRPDPTPMLFAPSPRRCASRGLRRSSPYCHGGRRPAADSARKRR